MAETTKSTMDVLLKYGPATTIALYLVWVLAAKVSGGQDDAAKLLLEHVQTTATMSDTLKSMLAITRINCVNQAKDEAGRTACARQ